MFTFPCESDDRATWLDPDDSTRVWNHDVAAYANLTDFPAFVDVVKAPTNYGDMYRMELSVPDETRDYTVLVWKQTDASLTVMPAVMTLGPEGATKAQGVAILAAIASLESGDLTAQNVWEYTERTLTSGSTTAVNTQQGGIFRIVSGDDYGTDSRELLFTRSAGTSWPTDLSEYDWTITPAKAADNEVTTAPDTFTLAVEVATATGASRSLRLVAAAADTDLAEGYYDFTIRGTHTGTGKKWSPILGQMEVLKDQV